MPGVFVKSQLSRMPGEERKFKRRRIVAFVPTCKREREVAALQTSAADVPAGGVVASGAGVAVGKGRGVAVGLEALVAVGEVIAVNDGEVEAGKGVAVGSEMLVPVEEGIGEAVAVNGGDVDEAGTTVGVARSGVEVAMAV